MFLIVSLKTVFENLNLVKSYDKTNPDIFVFILWKEYRRGLTFFGQYIFTVHRSISNLGVYFSVSVR